MHKLRETSHSLVLLLTVLITGAPPMRMLAQQTVVFTEDFETTLAALAANGWTWTGNAPVFVDGDNGGYGVGKESADLSVPPLQTLPGVPVLFHPVPYFQDMLYSITGTMRASLASSGVAVANIGLGWYHPSDGFVFGGINTGSQTWEQVSSQWPELQGANPGIPGAQFGVALSINPSAVGAHVYFDNISITTQPNHAMFMGRVLLEGPYNSSTGSMSQSLIGLASFPLTEPFSAMGYAQMAGGGGETISAVLASSSIVDWVRLELRSASDPALLVATRQAVVLTNGFVYDGTGQASRAFFGVPPGNYYIVVRHRNHLGVMSAAPVYVPNAGAAGDFNDFSSAAYAVWGTDARKTVGTRRVLWAGDVNGDHQLKYVGANNDRDPILTAIGGSTPTATLTGQYRPEDVNMDGVVKYIGAANDRDVILLNIGGSTPTAVRIEQVP